MEDSDKFKELMKSQIKTRYKGRASDSLDRHMSEFMSIIERATDTVASKVLDEARIEEIANAAKRGATYVGITSLVNQAAADLLSEIGPTISQMSQQIGNVLTEAASEAIVELIQEELLHRLE